MDRRLATDLVEGLILAAVGGVIYQAVNGFDWLQWLILSPILIPFGIVLGLLIHWKKESTG